MQLSPHTVQVFWDELEKIAADEEHPKRTWFSNHPQASKWKPKSMNAGPAGGALSSIGTAFSNYERYMLGRQVAQHLRTDILKAEAAKAKPGHAITRAYYDELAARGEKVPEGMGQDYKNLERPQHPVSLDLASFAGSMAIGLPTMALISAKHPEGKTHEELRNRAKNIGVNIIEHESPHYNPMTNEIGIPKDVHPSILAHELGHATPDIGKSTIAKLYTPAILYARLGMPIASAAALTAYGDTSFSKDDKERLQRLDKAKRLAALSALPYAPVLGEEARASARAMKTMHEIEGVKALPGAAATLLPAYGTYAAGLIAPALAYHLLSKQEAKIKKKMEKGEPHQKVAMEAGTKRRLRRRAEAALGGAAGASAGYLTARYLMPYLTKGKVKPNPNMSKVLAAITGVTGAALMHSMGAYANEPPPRARRELRTVGAVQPKNGELAQRHQGHPDQVLPRRVPPAASGSEQFSFRTRSGERVGVDRREEHGADHFRRGSSEYGFRGKEARTYHFKGPVRLRKHES